jgi:surface protein
MFFGCVNLEKANIADWDVSKVESMADAFRDIKVEFLDLSKWDTSKVKNFNNMFQSSKVKTLDLSGWDASNATSTNLTFSFLAATSLVGGRSVEDVISEDIRVLNGLKKNTGEIAIYNTNVDTASILALVNGLADLTGQTSQTFDLGSIIGTRLDTEQIAGVPAKDYLASKAGEKNWTIAY